METYVPERVIKHRDKLSNPIDTARCNYLPLPLIPTSGTTLQSRYIPDKLFQYHGYWYPVSLRCQAISSYGIYLSVSSVRQRSLSLQWRHNGCDGVSNHRPHHCLFNRLFGRWSKKPLERRITDLCEGNSPGEFPAQMASNTEIFPFNDVIMMNIIGGFKICQTLIVSTVLHENVLYQVALYQECVVVGTHTPWLSCYNLLLSGVI